MSDVRFTGQTYHDVKCICTTPSNRPPGSKELAKSLSRWFGCRYIERNKRSIERLMDDEQAMVVVVADKEPVIYHVSNPETGLFYHPGMAMQRLQMLDRGEPDRLLSVAEIREGDIVVDATLGLGADSLVFAAGVGEQGRVIAMEQSWPLFRLFTYVQTHPSKASLPYQPFLKRIRAAYGHHDHLLSAFEDDSVDVVYFDPMFRHPPDRPSSMDQGRSLTYDDPISEVAWANAIRIARRCVVLKERPMSDQFRRFQLTPDKPRARVAYGVFRKRG